MAKEIGRYDTALQMFIESPRPLSIKRLLFERYIVESGKGEHLPESSPKGDVALAMVISSNKPIEEWVKDAFKPQTPREQIMRTGDY